ncbi:MAG TPA: hypothetical protein VHM88_07690 [Candidatus Acidoferrales bacterium]|nr:hypothetical protein [Candidatus Acidoferrales bacterium]
MLQRWLLPPVFLILTSTASICAQTVATNSASTQTTQRTGATTIPLVLSQVPTGPITFQVLDSAGNVLGQWSVANGATIPQFNNMIVMDGVKYPYTGAGLQAAINDALALNTGQPIQTAVANGGAIVVIPKPFSIGSTTITNGVLGTGGQQQGGLVAHLWFAAPGQWTCHSTSATSPCFELASRSRVWGMGRFSQINNTGAGPTFRATSPAEDIEIRDLWLQGGLNAIKTRGSSDSTDVPGLRIRDNFFQSQAGNAIELVSLADTSVIDNNFINSPGGDCIHIGILDNGAVGGGTSENSTIANNFCQNYGMAPGGGRGFHFEPTPLLTAWQAVGWKLDTNLIGPAGTHGLDAFFFKGGGDVIEITNTTFVAPVGGANSDALHLEMISGGVGHSNFRVSGIHYGGGSARYGIFWDLLAQDNGASNELDRASVGNGVAAGIFVRGNILLRNIQQTTKIAPASRFNSHDAFKGGHVTIEAIPAGTRTSVTLNWASPFADPNYNVTCNVLDDTTGATVQGLLFERLRNVLAASVSATVFNPTAGALTGTLYCTAVHP